MIGEESWKEIVAILSARRMVLLEQLLAAEGNYAADIIRGRILEIDATLALPTNLEIARRGFSDE